MSKDKKEADGLSLLREDFPENQISKLPKPTKNQTQLVKDNFKNGARCKVCGGWHHPDVVHLDYVGHAAITNRLLDADKNWTWEPMAVDETGLPVLDQNGGLWIKLTVCGLTRLGYGHPDGKRGGDAIKEAIGDALRNAAMRFGTALDLWHKGDLHVAEEPQDNKPTEPAKNDNDDIKNAIAANWKQVKTYSDTYEKFTAWVTSDKFLAFSDRVKKESPASWHGADGKQGLADLIASKTEELKNRQASDFPGDKVA